MASKYQRIGIMVIVFFTYFAYGLISISDTFKSSKYYYAIGIMIPILGNFLWLYLSRHLNNHETIFYGGMWDLVVSISYPLSIIIFSEAQFTPGMIVGVIMFICGSIAFKL